MALSEMNIVISNLVLGASYALIGVCFLLWLFSVQWFEELLDDNDDLSAIVAILYGVYMFVKTFILCGIALTSDDPISNAVFFFMWFDIIIFGCSILGVAIYWLPHLKEYIADKRGV